jgi:hypothetical protein
MSGVNHGMAYEWIFLRCVTRINTPYPYSTKPKCLIKLDIQTELEVDAYVVSSPPLSKSSPSLAQLNALTHLGDWIY